MYKSKTPPTPGARILCRDAEWLITKADSIDFEDNFAIHCVGIDDLVRGHQSIFLTQLDDIAPVDPTRTKLIKDDSNGYKLSKLFLEAHLRQVPATGIEPNFDGLGVFKRMQFQKDTVRRALQQLRPRLLLADAVGLGKTIQVGMILSELMRRGRAGRILVLAKKSMLTQFQSELWNRFNIPLVRLDSSGIAKVRLKIPGNKNPFEVFHRVIISIDTLKNVARYEHFLKDTRWDVVIIDEAHNVAGASIPERHLSYRLARLLSRRSDSMLLTTATPHNGKKENFGRLISLLDPSAIPDPNFKEYDAQDIKEFFMMRFKEDIRQEATGMLAEREVIPLAHTTADATDAEEAVYEALAKLRADLKQEYDDADQSQKKRRHNALLQYGFYKLFLSSPEACLKTVSNRLAKLAGDDEASVEIPRLEELGCRLKNLTLEKSTRYTILKRQLAEIGWNGKPKSPRILIFTEYRQTQDALAHALAKDFKIKHNDKFESQSDQPIAVIHGGTPDTHLMKTVEAFATGSSPLRMMIATDVASEGINLHHECHHIIHYDLPWSIITLIQRNGRIDRLGQEKSPILRYIIVNTEQGLLKGDQAIFNRLIDKVEEINHLRQSGESVLQLYDPEAEEEYIANQGILAGNANVLEEKASSKLNDSSLEADALELMLKEANQAGHDDFMSFLLDDDETAPDTSNPSEDVPFQSKQFRLFADRDFLITGYQFLKKRNPDYIKLQSTDRLVIVNAPDDLKRRLGKSENRTNVIFGATAIPMESWPENDQFRLTGDPDHVELAIKAARNASGYWSNELLCSEQHPILQWLNERLLMTVDRGQAPIIVSPHLQPGQLCFCFIGQVSSKSGIPLIVDGHAISFFKGDTNPKQQPLEWVLSTVKFDQISNTGAEPNILAAQPLLHSAVNESIKHMHFLKNRREKQLVPLLRKEERRLKKWKDRREDILLNRLKDCTQGSDKAKQLQQNIEEMNDYVRDRQKNWRDSHFQAASHPSTRLIIAIQGAA
ncbi:ATP-dependent helicase [Desulfosarcina ovata subsp. sediminis]|uniref:ATP-dependent helicase n=1 Tax=Desulfosarcina ovata subsp. sediminis TaxID=885957 RepID=A0A5K7ZZ94_9BACT|nr:DEAD/DEAH box helicase [Desulfosarcina ovata]BBO85599.1 ATP-dependent helicase [Desulfosarcina ovata subsp. sediminis]